MVVAKKRKKPQLRRGLEFATYMVLWRAIKAGVYRDWAEVEAAGLCKPVGKRGPKAKRLDEIKRKRSSAR